MPLRLSASALYAIVLLLLTSSEAQDSLARPYEKKYLHRLVLLKPNCGSNQVTFWFGEPEAHYLCRKEPVPFSSVFRVEGVWHHDSAGCCTGIGLVGTRGFVVRRAGKIDFVFDLQPTHLEFYSKGKSESDLETLLESHIAVADATKIASKFEHTGFTNPLR